MRFGEWIRNQRVGTLRSWLAMVVVAAAGMVCTTPAQACWRVTGTAGQMQATESVTQGCFATPGAYESTVLAYMNASFTTVGGTWPFFGWRDGFTTHAAASPFTCTPQPVPLVNGSTYYCEVWATGHSLNASTREETTNFDGVGWFGLQYEPDVDPPPPPPPAPPPPPPGSPGGPPSPGVPGDNGASGAPGGPNGDGDPPPAPPDGDPPPSDPPPGDPPGCPAGDSAGAGGGGGGDDSAGNPIQLSTGEKRQTEIDYVDTARDGLSVIRNYRSERFTAAKFPALAATGLGKSWSHNWAMAIRANGKQAQVDMEDGSVSSFYYTGTGASAGWMALNGVDTLAQSITNPDGAHWVYRRASDDSTWQFAGGRVTSITRRNGWVLSFSYIGPQLTQVRNAFGRTLNFAYTPTGQLASITTPDGKLISYNADAQGRVARVTYADGTGKSYLYEDRRWPQALTTIVDERGVRFASFTYDAQGRGTSTEHAGGVERYKVSYGANQSALSSPLGAQYQYGYTAQGGALAVASANATRGLGSREAAQRIQNPDGTIASETDFLGVVNAYTWDSAKRPIAITRAAGRPEAQTINTQWHPTLRLPLLVTEAGRTTAYSYDAAGNKLSETTTDTATVQARTWAWTYNAQGLADTMTDPKGGVWKYSYDTTGNRTAVANPLGQQSSFSYDAAGRVTSQTAPNGLATSYSYDLRGRLTQVNRGGETSNYSYTPFGLMASATLPNGYAVSYSYDDAHRLIAATDSRSNTVQYTLDAAGNRVREETKDASGDIALVTSRVVNNLNQLAAIQGATGQTTQLAYDANGEATAQTDPLNQTTRQTLDALRRPTATTFADNANATQSYNQLDQLTAVNDPKGVKTSYQTNAFGEVMSETSPDIGTLKYERDALGDVTKKTDAKGNVTTITRDALGRPTSIQYAADHIVNYTYDSNSRFSGNQTGYLSRIEDKSGTTTYERDAQGRITTKTQTVNDNPRSPSRYKTSYSYVAGDLASITYPSGLKVIYHRNASGQITGIDTVANSFLKIFRPAQPFVSNLTYTALQQPKSWTWASGDSASRSFDADGRMTANEFASYTYDAASRITSITQSLWAGNTVNGIVNRFTIPLTWTAAYDNRNRLTSFDRPGASTSYTYDANSNRLTSEDTRTSDADLDLDFAKPDVSQATTQALTVDATSNRLLGFNQRVVTSQTAKADAVMSATINYSLDDNGAMTSDGLRTFEYDAANRMDKVRLMKGGEAASVTYLHNAQGQRVFKSEVTADQKLPRAKTLGSGFVAWLKANFQWMYAQAQADASVGTAYSYADGQLPEWALLGEYDNGSASGAGRTEYIWLPTADGAMPVGLYRGGRIYAVHADHLGAPRVMTNDTNTPVWQWPYSAFGSNKPTGVLQATAKPKQAVTNQGVLLKGTAAPELNLGFAGWYRDEETGTFYNTLRDAIDPATGRYRQPDPIGMAGGRNRYGYVGGKPLKYTDPFGLAIKCKTVGRIPFLADIEECTEDGSTPSEQEARDAKRMSDKELNKACKANGYEDAHALKNDLGLDSKSDIFSEKNGNMYSGPRKGTGVPNYLHMNTNGIVPK